MASGRILSGVAKIMAGMNFDGSVDGECTWRIESTAVDLPADWYFASRLETEYVSVSGLDLAIGPSTSIG